MNNPTLQSSRRDQSGSAILASLVILAVTLVAVSATVFEASHRFRTSYHSSLWAQAGQAAEAGADIGMVTANKASWTADGWSGTPGSPGTSAVTKTITLNSSGPSGGPVTTTIAVDKVTMGSGQWLRIRSTGTAAQANSTSFAGLDPADVLLRKIDLRRNRQTGAAISAPEAMRTVEVLAKPSSSFPYQMGLQLNKKITMSGGGTIDSFDSSNLTLFPGGLYNVANRMSNGDIGIIDTQGASDLKSTYVYGKMFWNGPEPANDLNVQGTKTPAFTGTVAPVTAPTWTTFNANPTIINNTTTLTGGPASAPALYKVSSLTVAGGKVLTLAPHAAGAESYIEVWVTGDFTTSGSGYILQQNGVHVKYHIAGDVTVSGSSFNNQSNVAANNIVELISPPTGTTQKVTVSGGGVFIGVLNAPGADVTLSGSASFSGAMIGNTMNISGGASLHFDEGLKLVPGSGVSTTYAFASLVEGVR